MTMSHISIRNVHKTYKLGKTEVHALRGVSLEITKSEFVGIIGPSGSGKSTLLNLIGCIDVPTIGEIFIDETNTRQLNDRQLTLLRRKHIGIIFQSFNLIPVLTAFENVELPLVSLGYGRDERGGLVNEMLEKTGILEYAHHKPDELSGGQRQRVAIARALVIKPGIVLADEPTANLDTGTGNRIVEIMKHMNETLDTTFIIATHDPRLLEYIDRRIFLEDGRIARAEEKQSA
jgi:putative ABC transport system ATP-binding protein